MAKTNNKKATKKKTTLPPVGKELFKQQKEEKAVKQLEADVRQQLIDGFNEELLKHPGKKILSVPIDTLNGKVFNLRSKYWRLFPCGNSVVFIHDVPSGKIAENNISSVTMISDIIAEYHKALVEQKADMATLVELGGVNVDYSKD